MNENPENISRLFSRLERLLEKQEAFSNEVNEIRNEINSLKAASEKTQSTEKVNPEIRRIIQDQREDKLNRTDYWESRNKKNTERDVPKSPSHVYTPSPKKANTNLEKFIGENLINKVGIAITIIGVSIGAKYSIDHDLISPVARIILGYIVGLSLLGFGIKLKSKYENYSAVLVSGAITIMYFMTYLAYSLYGIIPQTPSFLLMVLFTVFAVFAATKYNQQVIAHIGLVGAYAVPFLLSDENGNVTVLYSYMAIINIGILVISFLKYWKPLYYSSFILSWLIFLTSYQTGIRNIGSIDTTLMFLIVFFLIFYSSFTAYKIKKNEKFQIQDIILLLANSFLFYGIGYSILYGQETSKHFLGFFTVCNALAHAVVGFIIYNKKLADNNMFHFISGLVLIFLTIAIPVQLDGNWVTLLWAGEAALLFWIGKTKNSPVYEILSYPLMFLAFISIIQDWGTGTYLKNQPKDFIPLFNINFLTSLLVLASFGFITFLNQSVKYTTSIIRNIAWRQLIFYAIPAIFLILLYYSFRLEIGSFFHQQYQHSLITDRPDLKYQLVSSYNAYILNFKTIWMSNYTMLFLTILLFLNIKQLKNKNLGLILLGISGIAIAVFLLEDLYIFGDLREAYLQPIPEEIHPTGLIYILIRYISFAFVASLIYSCFITIKQKFLEMNFDIEFEIILSVIILWISSNELINWMDIFGSAQSYKLGLSIFWGVYALLFISLGIWKKKKYLRIGAIGLFAATLIKLFFYDISELDTISKTIVFVSLGVLLLIISFLYNKYKHIISYEN